MKRSLSRRQRGERPSATAQVAGGLRLVPFDEQPIGNERVLLPARKGNRSRWPTGLSPAARPAWGGRWPRRSSTEAHPGTALALSLDVTDHAQARAVAGAAGERFGPIDVLVNNAGHGYRAAVEEAAEDQVQELFAVNFFGPAALIRAILPAMRERRGGAIVSISSIAARSAPLGSGYYAASKAALEALAASLRKEAQPLGIAVMTVEPGAFRTNFLRAVAQPPEANAAYAGTVGARRDEDATRHGQEIGDPARAAQAIIAAVQSPNPPLTLVLGPDALMSVGLWTRIAGQGTETETPRSQPFQGCRPSPGARLRAQVARSRPGQTLTSRASQRARLALRQLMSPGLRARWGRRVAIVPPARARGAPRRRERGGADPACRAAGHAPKPARRRASSTL
jgi:NAD(P)-dependent dehydrogenase (short-subunit alcohol dehydrogenase family)